MNAIISKRTTITAFGAAILAGCAHVSLMETVGPCFLPPRAVPMPSGGYEPVECRADNAVRCLEETVIAANRENKKFEAYWESKDGILSARIFPGTASVPVVNQNGYLVHRYSVDSFCRLMSLGPTT